jgi:hypothetical protein
MTKRSLLISFILPRTELDESEMINSLSCSDESPRQGRNKHVRFEVIQRTRRTSFLGLLNRIGKFFAGFATGAENRSDPATNLPRPETSSLSSVTTPNGPWVYTVVPWED